MSRSKNRKIAALISGGTFDDGVVAASEVTGLHTVASTGNFNELENKPAPFDPATLADVAVSGSFNDLSNQPAPFDPSTLATVATTGAYSALSGTPSLATVATTGAYSSLSGTPAIPQAFPSGTKMLFNQTSAPTGWTKLTSHNNKALRVVSGSATSGGSVNFTTAFSNRSTNSVATSGTVNDTTLSLAQIPSHSHDFARPTTRGYDVGSAPQNYNVGRSGLHTYAVAMGTVSQGGGGSHNHSFSGGAHNHTLDMAVQYVDIIIASKD